MAKLSLILLIDDDPVNNYFNEKILIKLNLAEKIVVKKNGMEALDFIKETYPPGSPVCSTLIILDTIMPVTDGIEFLKEMNRLKFLNRDQFVILLLATAIKREALDEYFQNGVLEYTQKPLDKQTILSVYNRYWDEKGEWMKREF